MALQQRLARIQAGRTHAGLSTLPLAQGPYKCGRAGGEPAHVQEHEPYSCRASKAHIKNRQSCLASSHSFTGLTGGQLKPSLRLQRLLYSESQLERVNNVSFILITWTAPGKSVCPSETPDSRASLPPAGSEFYRCKKSNSSNIHVNLQEDLHFNLTWHQVETPSQPVLPSSRLGFAICLFLYYTHLHPYQPSKPAL